MYEEKQNNKQSSFTIHSARSSEGSQTSKPSNKGNTLNGHRAEWVVRTLIENITTVRYVKHWSKKVGMPESTLNRVMRKAYGQTPGEILKEAKYEKVLREIGKEPNALAYTIAVDSGFGSEDAQRRFLNENYEANITALKLQVISGKPPVEWKWLTGE